MERHRVALGRGAADSALLSDAATHTSGSGDIVAELGRIGLRAGDPRHPETGLVHDPRAGNSSVLFAAAVEPGLGERLRRGRQSFLRDGRDTGVPLGTRRTRRGALRAGPARQAADIWSAGQLLRTAGGLIGFWLSGHAGVAGASGGCRRPRLPGPRRQW